MTNDGGCITIDLLTEVMESVEIDLFTDCDGGVGCGDSTKSISALIDARRVFDAFAAEISNQTTPTQGLTLTGGCFGFTFCVF